MVKRILLLVFVLILCLPLVHFAVEEWGPKPQIDFNGEEWKARAELMTRADVNGSEGHGIFRLPQYIRRIKGGAVNVRPTRLM